MPLSLHPLAEIEHCPSKTLRSEHQDLHGQSVPGFDDRPRLKWSGAIQRNASWAAVVEKGLLEFPMVFVHWSNGPDGFCLYPFRVWILATDILFLPTYDVLVIVLGMFDAFAWNHRRWSLWAGCCRSLRVYLPAIDLAVDTPDGVLECAPYG
ncbi:hypothetical protein Nepgr_021420 [Nepenthes gracilis]|uniref:Uncharacterized protein n=1 Tax=Nepenthes gracilis TaxID=150966 RepID=A0AAD3SZF3_NEPGR|nr:hypothetical protein Nepgr_021420 [Nepenthes gracilis]